MKHSKPLILPSRVALHLLAIAVVTFVTTACSREDSQSPIAIVDVSRISASWPKFINYQNQLAADNDALEHGNFPESEKERRRAILQRRYSEMQDEVTSDVRHAAEQVASKRRFKIVVTRESVGYGGTDITPDVESILKISEPSPMPKP